MSWFCSFENFSHFIAYLSVIRTLTSDQIQRESVITNGAVMTFSTEPLLTGHYSNFCGNPSRGCACARGPSVTLVHGPLKYRLIETHLHKTIACIHSILCIVYDLFICMIFFSTSVVWNFWQNTTRKERTIVSNYFMTVLHFTIVSPLPLCKIRMHIYFMKIKTKTLYYWLALSYVRSVIESIYNKYSEYFLKKAVTNPKKKQWNEKNVDWNKKCTFKWISILKRKLFLEKNHDTLNASDE